ncbi:hypothetical protein BKA62DRAFT_771119 [Auriculariales sp. MPI-PUGE-AT-0066]|nr:hypothetical protein BKA62DRAFT_771119 [Auriculariales sp. MPI-PUGE-AT-0066]
MITFLLVALISIVFALEPAELKSNSFSDSRIPASVHASFASGGPSLALGGVRDPPTEWDQNVLRKANFNFSQDWTGLWYDVATIGIHIGEDCALGDSTSLCSSPISLSSIHDPISDNQFNYNRTFELLTKISVSEPVKPLFDVEVVLKDAVALFSLSEPLSSKYIGFDNVEIKISPLQSSTPGWPETTKIELAWVHTLKFDRTDSSSGAKVTRSTTFALALPRIVMTVTKLSGVNERCESVTTGETFNDLFKVETVATVDMDGKLLYNKPDLPIQCYSFDESQKRFVAPMHLPNQKEEDPKSDKQTEEESKSGKQNAAPRGVDVCWYMLMVILFSMLIL